MIFVSHDSMFLRGLGEDGEIGMQHVQGLLREVAHIQAGAEPHASRIGSTGSGNHLEQRGLARAVSPHDGPAFSAADNQIESFIIDRYCCGGASPVPCRKNFPTLWTDAPNACFTL